MAVLLICIFINRKAEERENNYLTLLSVAYMSNLFFFAEQIWYFLVPKGRMWLGLSSVMWSWVTPQGKPTRCAEMLTHAKGKLEVE